MTIFRNLTAEEVATQHQMLIELLLHAVSEWRDDKRDLLAQSIARMADQMNASGQNSTLLADAVASLRRQDDEAG